MKISEFRQKSKEDLVTLLRERRGGVEELRTELLQKKVKNVREVRKVRREIAQILTILKEKV